MQEFMAIPVGATSFTEAMKMGSEVYHNLKAIIKAKYGLGTAFFFLKVETRTHRKIRLP